MPDEPREYHVHTDAAEELIEQGERARVELAPSQLIPKLHDEFHSPRFSGRIQFNQHVHIPVLDKERTFPFGPHKPHLAQTIKHPG